MAEHTDTLAGEAPRLHWHPRKSHHIAEDGRIHALKGYRIHIERGRKHFRDSRRLCDELYCEACTHNCECLTCSGWCGCDNPPEPTTYLAAGADFRGRTLLDIIADDLGVKIAK